MDRELTKFQLLVYEHRIDEINALLNNASLPDDVYDNLIMESECIEQRLKASLRAIRIKESGLTIIG